MRQSQYILLAAIFGLTSAIPLNINLGAYSPALVVGDGEISLGAKESVSQIMGALQGAAVTAGTTNAGAGAGGAAPKAAGAGEAAAAAAPGTTQAQATTLTPSLATGAGLGNDLEPRIRPRVLEADASSSVAKRDNVEPRIHARDLAGFDRALNYATTALTTGPRVELATENAGVGMIIEAGVNNGGPKAGATGGRAAIAKRDATEEKRSKVTTVFVRELVDDVEGANLNKRDLETSISLDVSKARTLAMTFVESE